MAKGKYQEWITPEGLIKIEGWARDGLTDEQITHNMGISSTTLYDWEKKYPEISESLKRGKEVVDRQVENALFKRAKGYSTTEVTRMLSEETGKLEPVKEVVKDVPPDTTAAIFWLKNRKPDVWRDRKETTLTGNVGVNHAYQDLTTEELRKLANDYNTTSAD